MDWVLPPLTRRAVDKGAGWSKGTQIALNILEWRAILCAKVKLDTAFMSVAQILDLVYAAIPEATLDLDCDMHWCYERGYKNVVRRDITYDCGHIDPSCKGLEPCRCVLA